MGSVGCRLLVFFWLAWFAAWPFLNLDMSRKLLTDETHHLKSEPPLSQGVAFEFGGLSTQAFFCTKPKNSVLIFQELRSQKSSKTQFLPENSVPEQWIYENFHQKLLKKDNFRHFLPENLQIFRKLSSKKAKTQFSRNSWNINSVKCVQKKPVQIPFSSKNWLYVHVWRIIALCIHLK